MKDISCRLLVIGAGPGGYVRAIRAGQLGLDTVIVEAVHPRWNLPQLRLHPIQGAYPCRRGIRKAHRGSFGSKPVRPVSGAASVGSCPHDCLEGRDRRPTDHRGFRPAEAGGGQVDRRLGPFLRRQDSRGPDRDRSADHPHRDRSDRHRFGGGRIAVSPLAIL